MIEVNISPGSVLKSISLTTVIAAEQEEFELVDDSYCHRVRALPLGLSQYGCWAKYSTYSPQFRQHKPVPFFSRITRLAPVSNL